MYIPSTLLPLPLQLPKLKTIHLEGCPISKGAAYRSTVLSLIYIYTYVCLTYCFLFSFALQLPKLKTIYLEGCPISKGAEYRSTVLSLVPSLEQLDADAVDAAVRKKAGVTLGGRPRDEIGEIERKRQAVA